MSYEIAYLPTFIRNMKIWYAKKYSRQEMLERTYTNKIKGITKYLEKEFAPIYTKYKKVEYSPANSSIPNIIWIMWWQGENNMPPLVKACVNSIKENAIDYDVRIINSENYKEYIDVDDVISFRKKKFRKERMSLQYFSDIIRARLLEKHGGIWLDATMFITNSKFFEDVKHKNFFTIKLNNTYDNQLLFSSGKGQFCLSFWATPAGNPFFSFINECLTYHIQHHWKIWDYLLIEYSISIGINHVPFINDLIRKVPYSNPRLYWFGTCIHQEFNKNNLEEINKTTSIFKLNYKTMTEEAIDKQIYTYFDFILEYKKLN